MTRVPFGTTSSPFLLSTTLWYHFNHVDSKYQATALQLKESFYVGDLVFGASTPEEISHLYEETTKIMKLAGMNMQKWSTNKDRLRHTLKEKASSMQPTQMKVLVLYWNTEEDALCVNLDPVQERENHKANGAPGDIENFRPVWIFVSIHHQSQNHRSRDMEAKPRLGFTTTKRPR